MSDFVGRRRTFGRALVGTLRPKQWVKNAFVLAPLVFSKNLADLEPLVRASLAAAIFCALSGAVYTFNDLLDVEQDRAHPVKRFRPIAARELSEKTALILSALLASVALCGALALTPWLALVALGYLANNLAYTLKIKHIAFVDVTSIAIGFILRVMAGAFVIEVPVSPWLLACTGLLAAFLGFGKRAHELLQAGDADQQATETRVALAGYTISGLQFALLTLAIGTCAAYALYTRDSRTVAFFGTGSLLYTLPFCVVGIARFAQLALWRRRLDSPTDAILKDWPFLCNLFLWALAVVVIIYGRF